MKLSIRNEDVEVGGGRALVMGILNVTDDSFYDGGQHPDVKTAVQWALAMYEDGADIIDVGGESSRPGAKPVPMDEELKRVLPIISELNGRVDIPISIDTYKTDVARGALQEGASIINDISALRFGEGMAELAAETGVPVILMHMLGTPEDMQDNPEYDDVVAEVGSFLSERMEYAVSRGVGKDKIIIDPGIGFGKTTEHNLKIIHNLRALRDIGCPVLVGPSRKSFIGKVLDLPPEDRLGGTVAAVAALVMNGVDIVRVHDVKEMVRTVKLVGRIKGA